MVTDPKGATVNIDGEEAGTAPLTVQLAPGKHKIEVSRRGYVRTRKTVKISADKAPSPVSFKLKKSDTSSKHNVDLDPEEGPATKSTVPGKQRRRGQSRPKRTRHRGAAPQVVHDTACGLGQAIAVLVQIAVERG